MILRTTRSACRVAVLGIALIAICCVSAATAKGQNQSQSQQPPFRGGLNQVKDADRPHPVRNDVAQPGEEIVTLRYFKIKKNSFDEFLRVSVEGVWPYFEKLGSRVIGMWKVITPAGVAGAPPLENKDYDEVYLSTRYASIHLTSVRCLRSVVDVNCFNSLRSAQCAKPLKRFRACHALRHPTEVGC